MIICAVIKPCGVFIPAKLMVSGLFFNELYIVIYIMTLIVCFGAGPFQNS